MGAPAVLTAATVKPYGRTRDPHRCVAAGLRPNPAHLDNPEQCPNWEQPRRYAAVGVSVMLSVLAVALAAGPAAAQEAQEAPHDGPRLIDDTQTAERVTHVYPIADLLPERPAGEPAVGGGFGGEAADADDAATELIAVLFDNVPDADVQAEISDFNGQLIVTAPRPVQDGIADLLDQLRQGRPMLLVEVLIVEVPMASVGQLDLDDAMTLAEQPAVGAVRQRVLNGVTVTARRGETHAYVSDLSPVVGQGAIGYDPEVSKVFGGLTVVATPTLSADGRFATVAFDVEQSIVGDIATVEVSPGAHIQTFDRTADQVAATISLPIDQWLIAGFLGHEEEGEEQATAYAVLLRIGA
jgi:hypothetical protein